MSYRRRDVWPDPRPVYRSVGWYTGLLAASHGPWALCRWVWRRTVLRAVMRHT